MRSETGRNAVVVGAGSGMGSAVAARLHEEGYRLLLADLSVARLEGLATQLGADVVGVDIARDAEVEVLADRCLDGVDALVITAGVSMTMASFDQILAINLVGSARLLRRFAPLMREGGAAVCFASIAGHLAGSIDERVLSILDDPSPDMGERLRAVLPPDMQSAGVAYGLSKLGVLRLARRTGVAWGKNGVRVCSISPGVIDTPMGSIERKASPEADQAVGAAPIPRLGRAGEVANVAAFLVSPRASYITACDILVDGGWVGAIETAPGDSPFAQAIAAGREKN